MDHVNVEESGETHQFEFRPVYKCHNVLVHNSHRRIHAGSKFEKIFFFLAGKLGTLTDRVDAVQPHGGVAVGFF